MAIGARSRSSQRGKWPPKKNKKGPLQKELEGWPPGGKKKKKKSKKH